MIEVSLEGMTIAHEIGKHLNQYGGAALIIDYGNDHPSSFSLRVCSVSFIVSLKNVDSILLK
jgi:SAM-dependent MidA family methyltransferase